jgi:hypothetical protein
MASEIGFPKRALFAGADTYCVQTFQSWKAVSEFVRNLLAPGGELIVVFADINEDLQEEDLNCVRLKVWREFDGSNKAARSSSYGYYRQASVPEFESALEKDRNVAGYRKMVELVDFSELDG